MSSHENAICCCPRDSDGYGWASADPRLHTPTHTWSLLAFDHMLLSVPLRALTAMGMAGHRPTRVSTRRRHGTTHGVCWRSTTCCCWCLYTRPPAHARARQLPPARACAQATGRATAAAPAQHTAGPRAPCGGRMRAVLWPGSAGASLISADARTHIHVHCDSTRKPTVATVS